jgi:hypothetical protein
VPFRGLLVRSNLPGHIIYCRVILTEVAYGIFQLQGDLQNWQYLFIIEGAVTVMVAMVAWLWLPVGPGSAWFLTESEKEFAAERIRIDSERYFVKAYGPDGIQEVSQRLSKRDVTETVKDWKLWTILVCNICASVPSQAFSVFLPLVVNAMGYSSIQANLVSRDCLQSSINC